MLINLEELLVLKINSSITFPKIIWLKEMKFSGKNIQILFPFRIFFQIFFCVPNALPLCEVRGFTSDNNYVTII